MQFGKVPAIISISIFLLVNSFTLARSEQKIDSIPHAMTYEESFSGDDISVILGGQISFKDKESKWHVYLSDQKLVMKNANAPDSLHHDDIQWVRYSGSKVLSSTEGAIIAVTIEAENNGLGAAGFIVGSGQRGKYWMFGIDGEGRFHVIQKAGGKTYLVHSGKNKAIVKGQPSRLAYKMHQDNIVFFVNGTEIIQVPMGRLKSTRHGKLKLPGIGLAAFGLGTYKFDDVEIRSQD